MVPSSGTHPQSFAHHAGEDEGHDLVQVGLQLDCPIAHQAAQCLYIQVSPDVRNKQEEFGGLECRTPLQAGMPA